MKISELIEKLEEFKNEHGDLEVNRYNLQMDRVDDFTLSLRHIKILTKRESKPAFWDKYGKGEEYKGEKVLYLG